MRVGEASDRGRTDARSTPSAPHGEVSVVERSSIDVQDLIRPDLAPARRASLLWIGMPFLALSLFIYFELASQGGPVWSTWLAGGSALVAGLVAIRLAIAAVSNYGIAVGESGVTYYAWTSRPSRVLMRVFAWESLHDFRPGSVRDILYAGRYPMTLARNQARDLLADPRCPVHYPNLS